MILAAPVPFREALDAHQVKTVLPTTGRTADLQQLAPAIKQRALFSATVSSAENLQKIDDLVNGILSGQIDQASARLEIKNLLADQGYEPDPDDAGGLQDLGSTDRINLQLETNVATARGFGWFEQGQDPIVLDAFPAQQLVRFHGAKHERDWPERWTKVGGKFYDGRMIALKNDPIWAALGDPANFDDALGNAYPPFAFNSGMDVRDVDRDEAQSLGLLDENTEIFPQGGGLNDDLQASPDVRSTDLRSMLEDTGLGKFDDDGVFKFTGGGAS